ncbi:hypothetical protein TRIUR3_06282 [Triticum urartu]|uniref:Uncharacterized protein n=1 Tax=Triticum urartu TaxID=4572 RepID=M7YIW1_TRIUA|nr:hypothetical protein TRIUR3_06282 [Triticum urartu]
MAATGGRAGGRGWGWARSGRHWIEAETPDFRARMRRIYLNNSSAISASADVAFRHALNALPEPRSIEAMARAWDASVRKAVMWFARQQGGGTISSMFGGWKRCAAA